MTKILTYSDNEQSSDVYLENHSSQMTAANIHAIIITIPI